MAQAEQELTNHIDRLPVELLASIQAHAMPSHSSTGTGRWAHSLYGSQLGANYYESLQGDDVLGRMRLVCRYWNAVAVSTQTLWNIVTCIQTEYRSADAAFLMFQAYLQRSGSTLIRVCIVIKQADICVEPTRSVLRLLIENRKRIEALDWAVGYHLHTGTEGWNGWVAMTSLRFACMSYYYGFAPVDAPNLLTLSVDAPNALRIVSDPSKGDPPAELAFAKLHTLELVRCRTNAVASVLLKCHNLSALSIGPIPGSSKRLGTIPRLPHLVELVYKARLDCLPRFLAPHSDTLVHLRLDVALQTTLGWAAPFHVLPALRTLEARYGGILAPFEILSGATQGLREVYVYSAGPPRPLEILLEYLRTSARGLEHFEPSRVSRGLRWPRLRLLRLRFEHDDALSAICHEDIARLAEAILRERPALRFEILVPRKPLQNEENIDQLRQLYRTATEPFAHRIAIRSVADDGLPETPLAETYVSDELTGMG